MNDLKLYGYNNLAKTLNISFYLVEYVDTGFSKKSYASSIQQKFNSTTIQKTLEKFANDIGGAILHSTKQDYQPHGASVNIMISEGESTLESSSIYNHLDKSHICAHTYPEEDYFGDIAVFRMDLEISTCGVLTPLALLEKIFLLYRPHIVFIDYSVKGVNIDKDRKKQFIDHDIQSIQQYLSKTTLKKYTINDFNIRKGHFFRSHLLINEFEPDDIFNHLVDELDNTSKRAITNLLYKELSEIYNL